MSEQIPRMEYTRSWEDPADFATHQTGEVQNRRDIMSLFWELRTYINSVMLPRVEQLLAGGGAGTGGGSGVSGDFLSIYGGDMLGDLRLYRDPAAGDSEFLAATKHYVDSRTRTVQTDADGNMTALIQTARMILLLAEDVLGNSAHILLTARLIELMVQDAKGNYSAIRQTAEYLELLVKNALGNTAAVLMTADQIALTVEAVSGNRAAIALTAESITALVEASNGAYSKLVQTAEAISSVVRSVEGTYSLAVQEAGLIGSLVDDADGNYSAILQTADAIRTLVENDTGAWTMFHQTAEAIALLARNANGNAACLEVTAEAIHSLVTAVGKAATAIAQTAEKVEILAENAKGNRAALTVMAGQISSIVDNAQGNTSQIQQTAGQISTLVTNTREHVSSQIRQFADEISLSVQYSATDGNNVTSEIQIGFGPYRDEPLVGQITVTGNVDVKGQLAADGIYSNYGEVGHLEVDALSTARKIPLFLAQNTADVNYIRVRHQYLEFVTAACRTDLPPAQAADPDGQPLYWPVDVSELSGRDGAGYPLTAESQRVFTTTTRTAYPVQVYQYTEAVKRSIAFQRSPVNGIYETEDVFGAGNAQGRNIGRLCKGTNGLELTYAANNGQTVGVYMDVGGYLDLAGLRTAEELDFSHWEQGYFTEKLAGRASPYVYNVVFDGTGQPTRITTGNQELVIRW